MATPAWRFRLRERYPSLARHGVAAQHCPDYRGAPEGWTGSHDCLYLSLLLSGEAEHQVGDDRVRERPGSLCVVNYDEPHAIHAVDGPLDVFNCYLDPDRHRLPAIVPELRPALRRFLPMHAGHRHRQNRLVSLGIEKPALFATWLHSIESEQQRLDRPGTAAALDALLRLVLIAIARSVEHHDPVPVRSDDAAMEALRRHLDAAYAEPVVVSDVARDRGLSTAHLCRRFKAHTGCSILSYVGQQRLQDALERLRDDDTTIAGIAFAAGFPDLAGFNRRFKTTMGCTPRQYRARFRSPESG